MGSKAPPAMFLEEAADDGLSRLESLSAATSETSSARSAHLMRLIADTIGSPLASFSLRETPNAESVVGSAAANECGELMRAYLRIRNPEKRRRLLELVCLAGEGE
ncbi:hypothetical protein [Methylobacterium planeticum]|uniref:Uncharacterized protein n=1 Tax=Methylobacterium planeticum TaxID=2615211 RepID=A0A6N6MGW0_9HYPH|nr:hypothetical protein [Methylobacterium planeticum]KAB1068180.1 hypothetical protein F6X51_27100 [Methylobacterium planeticum]